MAAFPLLVGAQHSRIAVGGQGRGCARVCEQTSAKDVGCVTSRDSPPAAWFRPRKLHRRGEDAMNGNSGDASLVDHDTVLARARAEQAAAVRGAGTAWITRKQPRDIAGVLLLALACAGLLTVYARVLPSAGVAGLSVVVVLAIFFASALSSIAGFAFSAICGAMLFHLID